MKKSLAVDIISCLFVLLFLYTGINKLLDLPSFKAAIWKSPALVKYGEFIPITIPTLEISIAICLLISLFTNYSPPRKWGLYGSAVLMAVFAIYVGFMLKTEHGHLPCTCGGIIQKMNWHQHLYFNTAFTILALIGIWLNRQQYRQLNSSIAFT